MSTRFEHRATFAAPAPTVYSTLVDREFLDERLQVLGGKGAVVVSHASTGGEVTFRVRQGVDAARLPSAARTLLNGDLVVEREERWRGGEGRGRVTISGVPGEITSRSRVSDNGTGAELVITAEVRVGIPLVGGKLEGVIAEQVGKLLAAESEFTGTWLAKHRADTDPLPGAHPDQT